MDLDGWIGVAENVAGWTRGEEARELLQRAAPLPTDAQIVEVGSFLGGGAVLLAGARKSAGSGKVHCVDPFDLSGDGYSVVFYQRIVAELGGGSPRARFDANIESAGLSPWVEVHQGRAVEVASGWRLPIDMLFLDGDQSPAGARAAYEAWLPFLKPGGVIAVHNSSPGKRAIDHCGHVMVVESPAFRQAFEDIEVIGTTTFGVLKERLAPVRRKRPRIGFVQTADPNNYYEILHESARTVREYCRRHAHDYESYVGVKRGSQPWHASYNQLYILAEMLQRGQHDWVVCIDSDAYIADLDFNLEDYLADKAYSAVIMTPAFDYAPWWEINSGVLMFNLQHHVGRRLIERWLETFERTYSEDVLNNAVAEFTFPNDQEMLMAIMREHEAEIRPHLHLDDRTVLNAPHARFIRQMLRQFAPDLKTRVELIRGVADSLLVGQEDDAAMAWVDDKRKQVDEFLASAYEIVLGRQIDEHGRVTYARTLDALGMQLGPIEVLRALMGSDEFRARLRPVEETAS